MDTSDQALTKLTRLHDESHPTPHRPASLWGNYSLPVGSIMELAMEKGWWWRRPKIPLSGAPNRLQIWPPKEEQEVAAAPYRETQKNFLPYFFLWNCEFIALELGQTEPHGPHEVPGRARGGGVPWCLVGTGWPPSSRFWLQYFFYIP